LVLIEGSYTLASEPPLNSSLISIFNNTTRANFHEFVTRINLRKLLNGSEKGKLQISKCSYTVKYRTVMANVAKMNEEIVCNDLTMESAGIC